MKKTVTAIAAALLLIAAVLTGCNKSNNGTVTDPNHTDKRLTEMSEMLTDNMSSAAPAGTTAMDRKRNDRIPKKSAIRSLFYSAVTSSRRAPIYSARVFGSTPTVSPLTPALT